MSDVIAKAVEALNGKIPDGFDGSAKFEIEGEGSIILDGDGARPGDGEAEVTMKADADTFRAILEGELDSTAAFMSGRISVDGDMGQAMRLGSTLG